MKPDLFKARSARDLYTVLSGSALAQVIPFLISPVLSRIYDPVQYGALGLFMSFVAVLLVFSTFQYESAIVLPKEENDAKLLILGCTGILVLISILSLAVSRVFPYIDGVKEEFLLLEYMNLLPIFVFITGLFNIQKYWAIRKGYYKNLSLRYIVQSLGQTSTKLGLGYVGYTDWGLIIGTLVGQSLATVSMLSKTGKSLIVSRFEWSWSKLKALFVEYADFPKYTLPHTFLDVFNHAIVLAVLGKSYGITVVGYYAFSLGILNKPIKLFGASLSDVLYGNLSEKRRNSVPLKKVVFKVTIVLLLVGIACFVPIYFFGDTLFSVVFSDKWEEAGLLAAGLSPLLLSRFVSNPLSRVTVVLGKQRQALYFSLFFNVSFPLSIFILSILEVGYLEAFAIVGWGFSLYFLVYVSWIMKLVQNE